MKYTTVSFIGLLILSCSTAQLVDNWKNPDIDSYDPQKVLIVGMTPNIEARQKFEQQLKQEFELRGVEAMTSLELSDSSFVTERKTEEQLSTLENELLNDGFDTILLTKIIGVVDKEAYSRNYNSYEETYRRFREDYFSHQDIFYNPNYYDHYTVYHAETSMYCICPTKDRELIWKGYVDIIDPQSIDKTVNDYINLITAILEEQFLIKPMAQDIEKNKEAIN